MNRSSTIINRLIEIGRILWEENLITSHGGNLSHRVDEKLILITKTGAKLGFLKEEDFTEVPIKADISHYPEASSELIVHLAIYKNTKAHAIIHAHPPFTVALSLKLKEIKPVDIEGKLTFKKCPVLEVKEATASLELANKICPYLSQNPVVCIKGHGTFAAHEDIEKALFVTSAVEFSSKVFFLNQLIKALL